MVPSFFFLPLRKTYQVFHCFFSDLTFLGSWLFVFNFKKLAILTDLLPVVLVLEFLQTFCACRRLRTALWWPIPSMITVSDRPTKGVSKVILRCDVSTLWIMKIYVPVIASVYTYVHIWRNVIYCMYTHFKWMCVSTYIYIYNCAYIYIYIVYLHIYIHRERLYIDSYMVWLFNSPIHPSFPQVL